MYKRLSFLLKDYKSCKHITPEELSLIERFEQLLQEKPVCFGRQPGGHITASAWIVNPEKSAALLTHHKKFNKWLQLGGHCDDNPDVAAGALREAQEESGIQNFTFIIPEIFDIDIHAIPGPCAYHYDVRFLLQAEHTNFLVSDESHNLAWAPFEQMHDYSQEESVLSMNKKYREKFI
jgi:8-oxo-dGTP pyrophosphatase MutT (NUDIX family)